MAVKKNKEKKKDTKTNGTSGQVEGNTVNGAETKDSNSGKEVQEEHSADDKYNELNDRFLRLYAEFENFRKRTNKERLDMIVNANGELLKDLIPIIDDFERAITNNESSEDVIAIKEGFSLIYNKYKGVMETKGLKPMLAKGEVFDPEFHEAVANMPTEDKELKGKIIDDVEKGYLLNDKVLRYAKVVVGQ
jgi:molecular chaperone GrpE